MKKILFLVLILTFSFMSSTSAQSSSLDFLRSTGKIYSVIMGLIIVLIGLFWFILRLDRKLTKIEKHINHEQ